MWFLVLLVLASGSNSSAGAALTVVPQPFTTEVGCQAAGSKAIGQLTDVTWRQIRFVCINKVN